MPKGRRSSTRDPSPDAAEAGSEPSGSGPADEELGFEESLARLEAVVARLETGELELEQALAAFEEGVHLTRRCSVQLERSERRIEELVEQGGASLERPFEPEEG
jgi:exodeoxyribonuclease VII small subunit